MPDMILKKFFEKVSRATFWTCLNGDAPYLACLDLELSAPTPMPREHARRLQEIEADALVPAGASFVRFPFRAASVVPRTSAYFVLLLNPVLTPDVRYASFILLHEARLSGRHLLPDGRTVPDETLFAASVASVALRHSGSEFVLAMDPAAETSGSGQAA